MSFDTRTVERAKKALVTMDANRPIQVVMTDEQFKQKMAADNARAVANASDSATGAGIVLLVVLGAVLFLVSLAILSPRPYYYYRRYYW